MKRSTLVFPIITKHDVFDLKSVYVENFSSTMIAAVLIHFLFIGVYYFIQTTANGVESKPLVFTITFAKQPSIHIPVGPSLAVSSSSTSLKNAISIRDDKTTNEIFTQSQKELNSNWAQSDNVTGNNTAMDLSNIKVKASKKTILDFVPYKKAPEIIESSDAPVFQELAQRACLERIVFMKECMERTENPLRQ